MPNIFELPSLRWEAIIPYVLISILIGSIILVALSIWGKKPKDNQTQSDNP